MEDILREILYELKEIRKEIRADGSNSNPIECKVKIGEDVITEKVIKKINDRNRLLRDTTISV